MTYNNEDKMKSKEALRYLLEDSEELYNQYEEDEKFYLDAVELYNIVLKDLEILDILKNESDSKRIIERDGIVSFHLDMILTTDNYNKVKEWLENE